MLCLHLLVKRLSHNTVCKAFTESRDFANLQMASPESKTHAN